LLYRLDAIIHHHHILQNSTQPKQILEEACNAVCPRFKHCVQENRYKRVASYAGAALVVGACAIEPLVACRNLIATGMVAALIGVGFDTTEEERTYLAMIATKEINDLRIAFTLYTRMLKADERAEFERNFPDLAKKEQL
jgi:hypothetical protein